MLKHKHKLILSLGAAAVLSATNGFAEGKLKIYCSIQNEGCEKMAQAFSRQYHVDTQFVRQSTGVVLSKLKMEQNNPQADIWYGGTIEPHFQAAEQGLLDKYRSPKQADILPQFKPLTDKWGDYTSVVYLMVLGIGVNTQKFSELGLAQPTCFSDLLNPVFKQMLQYPDPRSSGTGYTFLTTLVQLWGEDKAFDYLKKLKPNVGKYANSGLATKNLSTGEVGIDISFMHSYEREQDLGGPVQASPACEGMGYALGGTSIIKGARNLDNAKLFMDWALSPEAQEIPWRETGAYQIPTNIHAESSPRSLKLSELKLIDYDYDRFSSPTEAKRLIDRWVSEVKMTE
ncbi:ABC transporter substrate-binding protein [Pasteurellaceae bacterium LIM206]|nr:ABC transporter substrate-binding protein [Pasteurellaceae bacterium LIM206]